EGKGSKTGTRPIDNGAPMTVEDIRRGPVLWAKLTGYSWWPARVATPEEIRRFKARSPGKDMVCIWFLGDNNVGWVKISNCMRFTRANSESYGSRITAVTFRAGVRGRR
ncbi:unnamed protein product, partial [Choristocarpus tenellus]